MIQSRIVESVMKFVCTTRLLILSIKGRCWWGYNCGRIETKAIQVGKIYQDN